MDRHASTGWLAHSEQAWLLLLDGLLTAFAARRIFSQFLRGPQPTLVASYVTLAVAGGILSPLSAGVAPLVGLVLWPRHSRSTSSRHGVATANWSQQSTISR